MWHALSSIWLAFAVSLDSFGAGSTYGMRKIKIPFLSTLIIACCSGIVIFLSMKVGTWLSNWLNPHMAYGIGAFILIGLGCWALVQTILQGKEEGLQLEPSVEQAQISVWTFEIRNIGLVVQILKTPMVADMDRSGTINAAESVLLGIALSLDAFGAGLGASMIGLPPMPVALMIAGMSALFLRLGMWAGFRVADQKWSHLLSYVPGICLIIMGLIRFF